MSGLKHNHNDHRKSDPVSGSEGKIPYGLLAPQAFVGLIDAVSYMVTAPSIVFYVLSNGGSYKMYGVILASFSFSSFLFKPLLGYWCDATSKFTGPYLASLGVASLGGFIYFVASGFSAPYAVPLILVGRFLGGLGAANSTLGFTYVAHVIDKKVLTQASAVLSMVRVIGMTSAPAINVFLDKLDFYIRITRDCTFQVTPLNAVGLFLCLGNLAAFFVIQVWFVEPEDVAHNHSDEKPDDKACVDSSENCEAKRAGFWRSIWCLEILVPAMSIFQLNTNFQLMETAMAPAASDALGYGPVGISALFGAQAFTIFVAILVTFELSRRGMKDETVLSIGLVFSVVGYFMLYLMWENPTHPASFFIPVIVSNFGFPFTTAPTRSLFTLVVDSKPMLRDHQGTMQALLSMDASIAGFVAPGLISSFVLRSPDEVAESHDNRELTMWTLYAPLFSLITLVGHLYVTHVRKPLDGLYEDDLEDLDEEDYEFKMVDETSGLLGSGRSPSRRGTVAMRHHRRTTGGFNSRTRARRRDTVTIMGIPMVTYEDYAEDYAQARRMTTGSIGSSQEEFAGMLMTLDPNTSRRVTTTF